MDGEQYRRLPHREDDNCFACSPNNSSGLQLQFFTNGDKVVSWLRVPRHMSGWDHIVHNDKILQDVEQIISGKRFEKDRRKGREA